LLKYSHPPDRNRGFGDRSDRLAVGTAGDTRRVPSGSFLGDTWAGAITGRLMTPDDFNISLSADVRGVNALHYLRDPRRDKDHADEMLLQASVVQAADAYTGAAVRALIESHLSGGSSRTVTLWPPNDTTVAPLFSDLVGPLPEGCHIPHGSDAALREPAVIVPASVVRDVREAEALALFLRAAAPHAPVVVEVARILAEALLAFAINGLAYAPDSPCGVVVCAALDAETNRASVVAIDQGQSVCASDDSFAALKQALARSHTSFGGLENVRALAARLGLESRLTVASGTGRIRRPGETRGDAAYVPGWCAALTIENVRPPRAPRR